MHPSDPALQHAFEMLNAGRTAEALGLFQQLAARHDPGALATLAQLTWSGQLLAQSFREGRELYRRAGDAGHQASAIYETNLLASGHAGARNWAEALKRLEKEARSDPHRAEILALVAAMELSPTGDPTEPPHGKRLSQHPDVMLHSSAFTALECAYIMKIADPNFTPANILDEATGQERPDPIRTSHASHFHWLIEDPAIHALNRRLAWLTQTDPVQGEPLQILRYRPGEQYRSHFDFLVGAENQRVLTALVYLNGAYSGGETLFTRTGLRIRGKAGDVLVFRNVLPDGSVDRWSEHAGLPVVQGVKYLASRWIRARQPNP